MISVTHDDERFDVGAAQARTLVLEPGRAERHYWRDLWTYRELFLILSWRDVAVRYKQTVIGVAWAVIRPYLTMVVFTIVFGRLAGLPSESAAPYSVMVFAGMLPWFLFSSILTDASSSIVGNSNLIAKVYFPRIIIPASSAVTALVDASRSAFERGRAWLRTASQLGYRPSPIGFYFAKLWYFETLYPLIFITRASA